MKKYEVYEQGEWYDVTKEFLEGVNNLDQITFLEIRNDELKVEYSNGNQVWYQDCHGTWGFPTVFE